MKILTMPLDQILKEVEVLDSQAKQIKYDLAKICWFMRGSLSMSEAYDSSPEDREIMSTLIKENLETAKKTNTPFW